MTSIQQNLSVKEVFSNAESQWQSFAYDQNGRAYLHDRPVKDMICHSEGWANKNNEGHWLYVGDVKDASDWRSSATARDDIKKNEVIYFGGRRNGKSTIFKGIDHRHFGIDPAMPESEKTVVVQFNADAQQLIEEQHKEILALKSLVNVQDAQLKEFESKEDMYSEVLSETLQTLYAADPETRVSLTAGQLLQLTEQPDQDDLPFF